jgi:DNA-binding MarR family transcriptional regulator
MAARRLKPSATDAPSPWVRTRRAQAHSEAVVTLLHAANRLVLEIDRLLRPWKLTLAQYNVLRILRGAGDSGAACGQIGSQLIEHDPDITRLVDRLHREALVERSRDAIDRRVVRTRITPKGLKLLAALDPEIDALHERQLGHLSDNDVGRLKDMVGAAMRRP